MGDLLAGGNRKTSQMNANIESLSAEDFEVLVNGMEKNKDSLAPMR